MASFWQKVIGPVFNGVGLVAPGVAGRLAFRLFSSTRGPEPTNDKEAALLAAARPSMAEGRLVRLIIMGGEVAAWDFPPSGKPNGQTVLVVHGWGSRIDYLQALVGGLRAAGNRVIGLDLPGHGGSSGRMMTVPMAIDAIDAASRQFGPFDAVIGHSFGGFVLVLAAAGMLADVPAHPVPKMVVVASPAKAKRVFQVFGRTLGFSNRVQNALELEVKRISGRPIEDFDASQCLAALDCKALVIHAEDDKEVHPDAARAYGSAGPHVDLHWANGKGHRRIISSPDVIEIITRFVDPETVEQRLSA